jgi:hypothetical protein
MTAYCISKRASPQWDFEKTGFFRKNRKHRGIRESLKGVDLMGFRHFLPKCPP